MRNICAVFVVGIFVLTCVNTSFAKPRKLKLSAWQDIGESLSYRNTDKGRACFRDTNSKIQSALVLSSVSVLHTRGKGKGLRIGLRLLRKIRARIKNESNSISLARNNSKAMRQIRRHLSIKACKKHLNQENPSPTPDPELPTFTVNREFQNLRFDTPVDGLVYPSNRDRMLIVEKSGIIRSFDTSSEPILSSIMLDIRTPVYDSGEAGLLGIDFDPDYPNKPYIYAYYIAESPLRTVVSRFTVTESGGIPTADSGSELEIISFSQPFENHNGGQIRFGSDGYLYIAVGDGGSANDPMGHGQDLTTLLGTFLRLDVSNSSNMTPYTIPGGNPFVGNSDGYREEIFAYGLRNPWRFSVDPLTGSIITGDVGQGEIEEVDIITNGGNYGWKIKEGDQCFQAETCDSTGLIDPIHQYNHDNGDRSITGGFVYHGTKHSSLRGAYIFADFVSGKIWAIFNPYNNETRSVSLLIDSDLLISAFVEDSDREILILGFDGSIYSLDEAK